MAERATDIVVVSRTIRPQDRHRLDGHSMLAHGETSAPPDDADRPRPLRVPGQPPPVLGPRSMEFHLGISGDGELLLLFRQGHLPEVIRVDELIDAWLIALDHGRHARPT